MLVRLNPVLTKSVIFVLTVPSEGTIRHRLRKLNLNELQLALNDKLKDEFIKIVHKKSQYFAIDLLTYHITGMRNTGDTIKTKPKQGTSRFFAYASIYLILGNKRFTFAVKIHKKRRKARRHYRLSN